MKRPNRAGVLLRGCSTAVWLAVGLWLPASAQSGPSTAAAEPPAGAASAPESPPAEPRAKRRDSFEGAVGLILAHRPAFSGSSDRQLKPELAGFVRWGRFSLSGAGGFTTKAQYDVERGLDALLVRRERLRVNLGFRFDPGRRESASDQLTGMGNVRATVLARLGLRWEPAPHWAVNLGTSFDALDRVGGYVVSGSVSRTFALGHGQRVILGAAVSGASDRYMQTWYGITPAQSVASGYPAYEASGGLRDMSLSATWRIDINDRWAGFAGLSASHLFDAAARSPLVRQRDGAGVSAGLARRF